MGPDWPLDGSWRLQAKRDFLHISVVCYYYLEAVEVCRLEVIRGASTPVDDVLVLALTAQLTVPVGDAQVVIHHALTVGAVLQHRVEERLGIEKQKQRQEWNKEPEGGEGGRDRETELENCIPFIFYTIQFTERK